MVRFRCEFLSITQYYCCNNILISLHRENELLEPFVWCYYKNNDKIKQMKHNRYMHYPRQLKIKLIMVNNMVGHCFLEWRQSGVPRFGFCVLWHWYASEWNRWVVQLHGAKWVSAERQGKKSLRIAIEMECIPLKQSENVGIWRPNGVLQITAQLAEARRRTAKGCRVEATGSIGSIEKIVAHESSTNRSVFGTRLFCRSTIGSWAAAVDSEQCEIVVWNGIVCDVRGAAELWNWVRIEIDEFICKCTPKV